MKSVSDDAEVMKFFFNRSPMKVCFFCFLFVVLQKIYICVVLIEANMCPLCVRQTSVTSDVRFSSGLFCFRSSVFGAGNSCRRPRVLHCRSAESVLSFAFIVFPTGNGAEASRSQMTATEAAESLTEQSLTSLPPTPLRLFYLLPQQQQQWSASAVIARPDFNASDKL